MNSEGNLGNKDSERPAAGVNQVDAIASQQGPVQVVKLESGDSLRNVLLSLVVAMALSVPLSVFAIFTALEASRDAEAMKAASSADSFWKQRLLIYMREKMPDAPRPE